MGLSKDERTNWLQQQVSALVTVQTKAEEELSLKHRQKLDLETRKYKRKVLVDRHKLEQDLLREVGYLGVAVIIVFFFNFYVNFTVI